MGWLTCLRRVWNCLLWTPHWWTVYFDLWSWCGHFLQTWRSSQQWLKACLTAKEFILFIEKTFTTCLFKFGFSACANCQFLDWGPSGLGELCRSRKLRFGMPLGARDTFHSVPRSMLRFRSIFRYSLSALHEPDEVSSGWPSGAPMVFCGSTWDSWRDAVCT